MSYLLDNTEVKMLPKTAFTNTSLTTSSFIGLASGLERIAIIEEKIDGQIRNFHKLNIKNSIYIKE